jgi:protein-disulfide isomerase
VPSGKKSKQLRRAAAAAPPPVQSKGSPRRRQANPRVLAIGGGVVLVVAVAVVLAIVLTGGSSNSGIPKNVQTFGSLDTGLPGASDVETMYKGIPQKGFFLGSPFAPAQMVIYIDLQCPICQYFETTEAPTIVRKYVRTGKLRIEVRPWAFIGPDSTRGQKAMIAAAKQNKAFNFAQILYLNQRTENSGWLSDNMVYQAAASVPGLNIPSLLTERNSSSVKHEISNVAADASANKVTGTPTIFVGKSGSTPKLVGAPAVTPTLKQVEDAITAASA